MTHIFTNTDLFRLITPFSLKNGTLCVHVRLCLIRSLRELVNINENFNIFK